MTLPNQTPPSVEDLLFGGGPSRKGRSLGFRNLGESHTITVTGKEVRQKLDDDGQPDTWADGNPKWQIVLTGGTDYRSADIEDDDGVRYLYIEGSLKRSSRSKMSAFAAALEAAGIESVELGGKLTMTYVSDGDRPTDPRKSAPKQFEAKFVRPVEIATQAAIQGGNGAAQNGHATAPVMSTATGAPVVHQQAVPAPAAAPAQTGLAFDATQFGYLDNDKLGMVQNMVMGGVMTVEQARTAFPPPAGWVAPGSAAAAPRLDRAKVKKAVPSVVEAQLDAFEKANLDTDTVITMMGGLVS